MTGSAVNTMTAIAMRMISVAASIGVLNTLLKITSAKVSAIIRNSTSAAIHKGNSENLCRDFRSFFKSVYWRRERGGQRIVFPLTTVGLVAGHFGLDHGLCGSCIDAFAIYFSKNCFNDFCSDGLVGSKVF